MKDEELNREALELHRALRGKLSVESKAEVLDQHVLSLVYSPGVASPCREIVENPEAVYDLTGKGNTVAVVTDGTAVLGLGDIGAEASLPVMEGKAVLFKVFADVDAYPVCLNVDSGDELVETVERLEPVFGGINLEDVAAPRCFGVEERLKESLDIPVFHDDQHGTAVITLGALVNGLDIVGKDFGDITVSISGAGAAGIAIAKILLSAGAGDVIICDSSGIIHEGRGGLNFAKEEVARVTNRERRTGDLADAMVNTDVFLGLSVGGIVSKEMTRSMADDPVVFPMANPVPEIWPEDALEAGAQVMGTGRSDYPNQVNNVLGFPGIFRGALDVAASDVTEGMKMAAAEALAELARREVPGYVRDAYPGEELSGLSEGYVIPKPVDRRVVPEVAAAVAGVAVDEGVARRPRDPEEVREEAFERLGYAPH